MPDLCKILTPNARKNYTFNILASDTTLKWPRPPDVSPGLQRSRLGAEQLCVYTMRASKTNLRTTVHKSPGAARRINTVPHTLVAREWTNYQDRSFPISQDHLTRYVYSLGLSSACGSCVCVRHKAAAHHAFPEPSCIPIPQHAFSQHAFTACIPS